jgi:ketosteroid isomerase-like protein
VPVLGIAEGQVVSTPEPGMFAEDWSAAWNRPDVDALLTHFHDDVVFTSPVAARVVPESAGVVRGKAALRAYRNQSGALVNEVLEFDGGLVCRGHGTYLVRT